MGLSALKSSLGEGSPSRTNLGGPCHPLKVQDSHDHTGRVFTSCKVASGELQLLSVLSLAGVGFGPKPQTRS
jgi:hypothetical protein